MKRQSRLDNMRNAQELFACSCGVFFQFCGRLRPPHEIKQIRHSLQRIVDFVGDRRSQLSDRSEFLTSAKSLLSEPALSNVLSHTYDGIYVSVSIQYGREVILDPDEVSLSGAVSLDDFVGLAALNEFTELFATDRLIFRVHQVRELHSEQLPARLVGNLAEAFVHEREAALEIHLAYTAYHLLHDRPEAAFAFLQ